MPPSRKEKIREKISYFRNISSRIVEMATDALNRGDIDVAEYIVSPNALAQLDRLLHRANAAIKSHTPWPQRKAAGSIADAADLAEQVKAADAAAAAGPGPGAYSHHHPRDRRDDEITSVNHRADGRERRESKAGGRRASDHAKKR